VPFKGELSNSNQAMAQRDRAASLDEEGKAIERAKASDRSAKRQLHKKVKASETYLAQSEEDRDMYLQAQEEEAATKRYKEKRSGKLSLFFITTVYLLSVAKWIENALSAAHKKWSAIQNEIDKRRHQRAVGKAQESDNASLTQLIVSRLGTRLFSSSSIYENILRREYETGL
jgi:hypothetical protein